jgi:hypothetical protein
MKYWNSVGVWRKDNPDDNVRNNDFKTQGLRRPVAPYVAFEKITKAGQ